MKKFKLIYYIILILVVITACEKEDETIFVTGVTLNNSEITILVSETAGLIATVSPEEATDKSVSWMSSDDNIATVNSTGLVTAISVGGAIITVKTTFNLNFGVIIVLIIIIVASYWYFKNKKKKKK